MLDKLSPLGIFYSMTPKPHNPIYLCSSQVSPMYQLPPELNCESITCKETKKNDLVITMYSPVSTEHHEQGVLCYRTRETCRFTSYFFGAQTSACHTEYVPTTPSWCCDIWQAQKSQDGHLVNIEPALKGTINIIAESYSWPGTVHKDVSNTYLRQIQIIAENDTSPIITPSPTDHSCLFSVGQCPSMHNGWLIWNKPQHPKGYCDLKEVGRYDCARYDHNIRCPQVKMEFDVLSNVTRCGKTFDMTKQGVPINIAPQTEDFKQKHSLTNTWETR
jgi:hypothetical protein